MLGRKHSTFLVILIIIEVNLVYTTALAANDEYSSWGSWSKCSKTCGGGTKERKRECANETPANGGNDCQGPSVEKVVCQTRKCPHQLPKNLLLCEGREANVTCPSKHKIHIISAIYGRVSGSKCSSSMSSNTNCRSSNSERKVTDLCSGHQQCVLNASNTVFGDPCVGTSKYLHVIYRCIDQNPGNQRIIICQHGTVNLTCAFPSQMIHVVSAKYGRLAPYHCPPTGPYTQHCRSPTAGTQVKSDCEGKNGCLLRSSNSVFGNPCNKTTTYLEVMYKCIKKKVAINGGYSAWSSWSKCTKTCGEGMKERKRVCDNPKPANGGKDCQGTRVEKGYCQTRTCTPSCCHPLGSLSLQCDEATGSCLCKEGVVGLRCGKCGPGTNNIIPNCKKCSECANRWSNITTSIENDFYEMESKWKNSNLLNLRYRQHSINEKDLEISDAVLKQIKMNLMVIAINHEQYDKVIKDVALRKEKLKDEEVYIDSLLTELKATAEKLKRNITSKIKLIVSSALNDTLDSSEASNRALKVIEDSLDREIEAGENKRKVGELSGEKMKRYLILLMVYSSFVEKTHRESLVSARAAKDASDEVHHLLKRLVNDTGSLSIKIKDYVGEAFIHPNVSKNIAEKTLNITISLSGADLQKINNKMFDSVINILGQEETVKKLTDIKHLKEARNLKRESEVIYERGKKMVDEMDEKERTKNATKKALEDSYVAMNEIYDILPQIFMKEEHLRRSMQNTQDDVKTLAYPLAENSKKLERNRQKMDQAKTLNHNTSVITGEIKKFVADAKNVTATIETLSSSTKSLQNRLKILDDNAVLLFKKSFAKISILTGLKLVYERNLKRTNIIYADVGDLVRRAKLARDRIQSLADCHAHCNPLSNKMCGKDL